MSFTKVQAGNPANDGNDFYSLEAIYDFSQTSAVANTVIEMLQIPAGSLVTDVVCEVLVADTGNTFDIGDGATVDGYLDGVDATAVVTTVMSLVLAEATPNTVVDFTNGKHYASADSIDLKVLGQTFAAAKIRVKAFIKRVG